MKQHLYNDAMLAIFPIQEFLATDKNLTNPNMDNERINNPAVFPHYWRYRMHLIWKILKQKILIKKLPIGLKIVEGINLTFDYQLVNNKLKEV
jgi:4-alpha-glucanotransferase